MIRVLYVEDNDDNAFMLSSRLRKRGFAVSIAVDGEKGVAAARRDRPDIIVMDLHLPVLDGFEATRRLKADPVTRAIPVVALSAHAMAQHRDQALAAGCDDYDIKPVDLDRLVGKLNRLLDAREKQEGGG
ncbi:MAG: response regulator [Alphaproteobacteria bacterium]|nr:response regulator [Alphaproteobacteria bacterium]